MDGVSFKEYYDDETYLLEKVAPHFRLTGKLDTPDFMMMLIWKAERAKNHHKKRLREKAGSFRKGVEELASDIWLAKDRRNRLQVLMSRWGFLLPTGTAILTLLYQDEFTVYDWRVCEEVGIEYGPWCYRGFSDSLWEHYESFQRAVMSSLPEIASLREKDRFLIGRSNRKSIEEDCRD